MFHQFKVDVEHLNFLRFLWRENLDFESEPIEFRMTVHLFGASSSPGCANYGLKQIATDNQTLYGKEVTQFIHHNFYVDDGLKSVSSVDKATSLIEKVRQVTSNGGLNLHKFISNSPEVMKFLPPEARAKGLQDLDLLQGPIPIERALGVQWCIESDSFCYRITLKDQPFTRRGILATVNAVYDPLGFIAPDVLIGKVILQKLCKDQYDWDSPIPDTLRSQWEKWRNGLLQLEGLHIARCLRPPNFGELEKIEIHHFSDASSYAYGQCSYLRLVNTLGQVHCSLLIGKARVAPLKLVTIPRLELNAALLSVRMGTFLKDELEYDNITQFYWTDSRVVLGYISNDSKRFHVFVGNRVQQIRDGSDISQWRYVNTSVNPADEGSRGVSPEDFLAKSKWLHGPDFIWASDLGCDTEINATLDPHDPELRKVQVLHTHSGFLPTDFELTRFDYFSNWFSLKRAVALCLRFKANLRSPMKVLGPVTVEELQRAEKEIIRIIQCHAFKEEIALLQRPDKDVTLKQSSSIYGLDPFLDKEGILRVGGRIRRAKVSVDIKHPMIIPKHGHVTNLIIASFHDKVSHQGRGLTINKIRSSGYWIIACSAAVRKHIFNCVPCRRLRCPVQGQKMADLPTDRLDSAPPFSYCGVDFFGP